MSPYRKFVVAAVGALVAFLHSQGVEVAEDISQPVIALVTALLVYVAPNS